MYVSFTSLHKWKPTHDCQPFLEKIYLKFPKLSSNFKIDSALLRTHPLSLNVIEIKTSSLLYFVMVLTNKTQEAVVIRALLECN